MRFLNRMLGLEQAPPWHDAVRERRRDWLTGKLISVRCRICGAETADGCDYSFETGDDLIMLGRDPHLFAHASRMADALAAHPAVRRVTLAQFEQGTAPAVLTGDRR